MTTFKVLAGILTLIVGGALVARDTAPWDIRLIQDFARIAKTFPGEFGVYLKAGEGDQEIKFQEDKVWYLSKATKILVAAAFLNEADKGRFASADRASGERLLKQMFAHDENSAADSLLRQIGRPHFLAFVELYLPKLKPIADSRQILRAIYSEVHAQARGLSNKDLSELDATPMAQRLNVLERKLYLGRKSIRVRSIDEAFERFYERGVNSVRLDGFGKFSERLLNGKILSPSRTEMLAELIQESAFSLFEPTTVNAPAIRHACAAMRISSPQNSHKYVLSLCAKGSTVSEDFVKLLARIKAAIDYRMPVENESALMRLFSQYR